MVFHITPERVEDTQYHGQPSQPDYIVATGTVEGPFETAESFVIDLICPKNESSIFADFLAQKGEGMIYLSPNVISKADFEIEKKPLKVQELLLLKVFIFLKHSACTF